MKKNNKMNFYLKAYPGVVATRRIKTGTITTIDFLLFGVFPFGLGGFPSLSFGKLPPEILKYKINNNLIEMILFNPVE